jgi:hypothetical protein
VIKSLTLSELRGQILQLISKN